MNQFFKKNMRKLLKFYQRKRGIFRTTNIETYAFCNRKCDFCFNNERFQDRDKGIMEESLYFKIIDELASINYAGRISPHFYGEPLLDKRLTKFVAYARQKCPNAYIRFGTNGDFLTRNLLVELVHCGVSRVFVTNYDDIKKENLTKLSQEFSEHIVLRSYKDMCVVNKAGAIFDKENPNIDKPCLQPSSQLVVNWKGNVLLCCNDYYEQHIFGNANDKTTFEIWKSKEFKKYRKLLKKQGGRRQIDICRNCDL